MNVSTPQTLEGTMCVSTPHTPKTPSTLSTLIKFFQGGKKKIFMRENFGKKFFMKSFEKNA